MNSTHLGSGLFVCDAADEAPKPRATREGPRRYRPEIQGIKAGAVLRVWSSPETFDEAAPALAIAEAQFARRAGQ